MKTMSHPYFTAIGVFVLAVLANLSLLPASSGRAGSNSGQGQVEKVEYVILPGTGKKCWVDDNFYFTYEFTTKPRMGTAILRIQVFDQSGTKTAPFMILGRYDMPSMAGAHDSGDQEFKLNQKGDYLLPLDIVMPGEWEVKLTFRRGETAIFRGAFRFDV